MDQIIGIYYTVYKSVDTIGIILDDSVNCSMSNTMANMVDITMYNTLHTTSSIGSEIISPLKCRLQI